MTASAVANGVTWEPRGPRDHICPPVPLSLSLAPAVLASRHLCRARARSSVSRWTMSAILASRPISTRMHQYRRSIDTHSLSLSLSLSLFLSLIFIADVGILFTLLQCRTHACSCFAHRERRYLTLITKHFWCIDMPAIIYISLSNISEKTICLWSAKDPGFNDAIYRRLLELYKRRYPSFILLLFSFVPSSLSLF